MKRLLLAFSLVVSSAATIFAACAISDADYRNKQCPCVAPQTCDTITNQCVDRLPAVACDASCAPDDCGDLDAGCAILHCGDPCQSPTECSDGKCVCIEPTCQAADVECGYLDHKCDMFATPCHGCDGGGACNGGQCGVDACAPKSCQPGECGTISDGCEGSITCQCTGMPVVCGNGVDPHRCCTPKACAGCKTDNDGCGNKISCACENQRVCTGDDAGVCCDTCATMGYQCTLPADMGNCGPLHECGACTGGKTCGVNHTCVN